MKPDTENIYQRKINQVIDYINANLHLPLRLDIIAGQVNVSERQLLRIMKGALNESLYAYVARQRVERAGSIYAYGRYESGRSSESGRL